MSTLLIAVHKKMYEGKGRKRRKKRASELDAHVEEMTALLSRPGTSVKAAYWFLKNERQLFGLNQ